MLALRGELPALLAEDVATVAPILREITGPVVITQGERTGKRGAVWIAKFRIDAVPRPLASGWSDEESNE